MTTLHLAALIALFYSVSAAQVFALEEPCTPIDRAGYEIRSPGRYCVTRDLHTRLDFADHRAERAIIEIKSSDVILDLQGHRLGRGWLLVQPGGNGITIDPRVYDEGSRVFQDDRMENITIQNGRITDFAQGIAFYRGHQYINVPIVRRSLSKVGPAVYKYETSNILVRNISFERCEENFSFSDWASSREQFLREKDVKPPNFRSR